MHPADSLIFKGEIIMKRLEFDDFASGYYTQHASDIKISGETPEYFHEFKIRDLKNFCDKQSNYPEKILDFGAGIGNSIPYFRKFFPNSHIYCADVSEKSLELLKARYPGKEDILLEKDGIPAPDQSFDIVFVACVFHHIEPNTREYWLSEIQRVTRPNGKIFIFEHNPINPLTLYVVKHSPIDKNAHIIKSKEMKKLLIKTGWKNIDVQYKIFFPSFLKKIRPLERYLVKCALGAQYRIVATKPS